jgi:hypothetical protein
MCILPNLTTQDHTRPQQKTTKELKKTEANLEITVSEQLLQKLQISKLQNHIPLE